MTLKDNLLQSYIASHMLPVLVAGEVGAPEKMRKQSDYYMRIVLCG